MSGAWWWGIGIVVVLVALDRVLLRCEARGWINYRRRGLSRGAAGYHALTLQSVFDPSARHVIDAAYRETVQHPDSGEAPGGDPDASPQGSDDQP